MAMIEDNKDNRQKSDEILKAKKRAMLILQHNDRTEWELTDKLNKAGFSEEAAKTTTRKKTPVKIDITHQRKIQDVTEYRDRLAFETGITLIVIGIVAVFLYISFFGLGGVVGRVFGGICFGFFGWAAESHRDIVDRRLRKVLKAGYEESTSDVIQEAMSQLDEYFNGERTVFEVPLLFVGTEFQKSVWYKLLEIPYGSTVSYGELAKQLDLPKAVRAVAAANGANAISIFAPCHRVIGSNRTLVGYGGGLPAKKRLLDLELNGKPLL